MRSRRMTRESIYSEGVKICMCENIIYGQLIKNKKAQIDNIKIGRKIKTVLQIIFVVVLLKMNPKLNVLCVIRNVTLYVT